VADDTFQVHDTRLVAIDRVLVMAGQVVHHQNLSRGPVLQGGEERKLLPTSSNSRIFLEQGTLN